MKRIILAAIAAAVAGTAYAATKCIDCNGTGWKGNFKCTSCGGDGVFGN